MKKIFILNLIIFNSLISCKTNFKKKEIEILEKAFNYKISSSEENNLEKIFEDYKNIKSKLGKNELDLLTNLKLINAENYFYKGDFKELENFLKKFANLNLTTEALYIKGVLDKKLVEELNKKGFLFPYSLLATFKGVSKLYIYDLIAKEYREIFKLDKEIEDPEYVKISAFQMDKENIYDILAYMLIMNIDKRYEKTTLGEYNRRIAFDTSYLKSDLHAISYNTTKSEKNILSYTEKDLDGIYTILKVGNYPFNLNLFLINFIDIETKRIISEYKADNSTFIRIGNDEFMPARDLSIQQIVLQNSINICKRTLQKIENIFLDLQSYYAKRTVYLNTIPRITKENNYNIDLIVERSGILNRILNNEFKNETRAVIAALLILFSRPYEDTVNDLRKKLEAIIQNFPNASFLFLHDQKRFLNSLEEIKTDFYLY